MRKVEEPEPELFEAKIVATVVPLVVGVPLITPEDELRVSPRGKPFAA
jgi:hypothetical protein